MKFRLIIKGSKEAAIKACEDREFNHYLHLVTNKDQKRNYTVIYVESDATAVARWFCEQDQFNPGYGYPDGTLLHYTVPKITQVP